jgi:hypothetical protein
VGDAGGEQAQGGVLLLMGVFDLLGEIAH